MAGILSLKYDKVRIIFLPDQISGIWNFYKINHSTENYRDFPERQPKMNGKENLTIILFVLFKTWSDSHVRIFIETVACSFFVGA